MSALNKGKPTQEEINEIESLMLLKIYSSKQIASIMGRTKGSIVGIIWRTPKLKEIGLPHKFKLGKKPMPIPIIVEPETKGPMPMIQLKESHCKFPLWGHQELVGSMGLFCADPKLPNSSYCDKHHKLCITLPYQHSKPFRLRIKHS